MTELTSDSAFLQINLSSSGQTQIVASRDKLADKSVAGSAAPAPGILNLPHSESGTVVLKSLETFPRRTGKSAAGGGGGGSFARGFSGTQIFNSFGATKEPGEPLHCDEIGGASMWFTVLAEGDGMMQASTEGSDFDTVLAAYSGPDDPLGFDELRLVGCDDDSGLDGQTSRLAFPVVRNRFYYLAVDGVGGARGIVQLNYSLGLVPQITQQPAGLSVLAGESVTLSVQVAETDGVKYQWLHNGTVIPGAIHAALTLESIGSSDAGVYKALVSNATGEITSNEAELTVVPDDEVLAISGIRFESDHFAIAFPTRSGSEYALEYKMRLKDRVWTPSKIVSGNGSEIIVTEPASTEAQRFYRIRALNLGSE